ncbi:asparagine synthase-related protein [Streptomyces sp. NPDC017056]|uniref:asparagine synthase-related protein n=1 Tax=Streptomyces sp. NPDC017056 TaxID=3364973 RepID=UPI0037A8EA63
MADEVWFAVFPDGGRGPAAARLLRARATEVVTHHSGRPWLLGSWPAGQVVVAAAGSARMAVIGRCPVTAEALADRLRALRDVSDTERALAGLPGSFHAVTSADGRVRVRGSASAVRRVFHARVEGVTVAACRADTLAAAVGAGVDERHVALHLLATPPPYPLGDGPGIWRGVESVAAGHCLLLDADGRAAIRRWWTPPEPELSAAQGADAVCRALTAAVDSCTTGRKTVSADLSGGMDSTSLCFLADRGPARLVTFGWESVDPANDDAAWAARAAARLPGAEHVRPERTRAPLWFSGMTGLKAVSDEPGVWARDSARLATLAGHMAGRGSGLHLSGGGGDELFGDLPPYLHDVLRSHPWAALGRVRRARAVRRGPLWPLLRGLADRSAFTRWLTAWADHLTQDRARPAPARYTSGTAWGTLSPMPPWATQEAVRAARDLLRAAAAEGPEPLAERRGRHAALSAVQTCGRAFRQVDQVTSGLGLPYAAPFLDDGVIEAALSVRVAERSAPGRYKPVLAEAMRGVVPDLLLARSTKGEYTADFYSALRRNRSALAELFNDSRLAGAGLLDTTALGAGLGRPQLSADVLRALDNTLACEVWLRSVPGAFSGPVPGGG